MTYPIIRHICGDVLGKPRRGAVGLSRRSILGLHYMVSKDSAAGVKAEVTRALRIGVIGAGMRRHGGEYVPVREDWMWNVILPTLVYGCFLAMALLVWRRPAQTLYGVAG